MSDWSVSLLATLVFLLQEVVFIRPSYSQDILPVSISAKSVHSNTYYEALAHGLSTAAAAAAAGAIAVAYPFHREMLGYHTYS